NNVKRSLRLLLIPLLILISPQAEPSSAQTPQLTSVKATKAHAIISLRLETGKQVFLDKSLSEPRGQACANCHQPEYAFADPRTVSPGAVSERAGTRNAPSLLYAALIPSFAYEDFLTPEGAEVYAHEGGLFWDGRARDLFEQVQQPFFNHKEMNLSSESELAHRLRRSSYSQKLKELVGARDWADDGLVTYHAYLCLVELLRSPVFRPFNSKFDAYRRGDQAILNEQELRGMKVYIEKGKCDDCHPLSATNWDPPLLSDFGFDNLGVPSSGKPDLGLGKHTGNPEEIGKFRSPSLRNVALTAPYMHNGSLKTLKEVVEFYNLRDTPHGRWKTTDFPNTVNRTDLGNLQLSQKEMDDLIAFLHCFTDRHLNTNASHESLNIDPEHAESNHAQSLLFPGWTHRLHRGFKAQKSDN
ncbi:MAG: cytochrome c peroxidase, partial [Planctomycetota bacterium]|nr:cytochrome c peroxidase [Planctomycetota bacterium]